MSSTPLRDPRDQGPKPPFDEEKQSPPGSSAEMNVPPDYGEQSYKGCSRLQGRKALLTGADSGIGRAVALAFARKAPTFSFPISMKTRTREKPSG